MQRCLELARLGQGHVAPNPMVGAVLVYNERIIGEGYHQQYGGPHAEVNCLASVKEADEHLIQQSTLYVSLEPCSHYGKTPPCADLVIRKKIPVVVIGCRDPFVEVNGKGIEKLEAAGVRVIEPVLEDECRGLNKRFFIFYQQHRPYVVLKWAQSLDGRIASADKLPDAKGTKARLLITNEFTNRLVHKWRSEEMAILVGTNTALYDDPALTTRLWPGKDPVRLVVDKELKLPSSLKLFDTGQTVVVFNLKKHSLPLEKTGPENLKEQIWYYQVTEDASLVHQVMNALCQMNIQSVLVEGGAQLLQSFIDEGAWDEARVITNEEMVVGEGLPAPLLSHYKLISTESLHPDVIRTFRNQDTGGL